MTSLPRDIHGAPPESLVVKLAEILGNYRTVRKMALFWCCVVAEVCLSSKEFLVLISYTYYLPRVLDFICTIGLIFSVVYELLSEVTVYGIMIFLTE